MVNKLAECNDKCQDAFDDYGCTWKVGAAICVVFLLAMVVLFLVLVFGPQRIREVLFHQEEPPEYVVYTLENLLSGDFSPNSVNFQWMPNVLVQGRDGFITMEGEGTGEAVLMYFSNAGTTGYHEQVINSNSNYLATVNDYQVASNLQFVLFSKDVTGVFRYSTLANYDVCTTATTPQCVPLFPYGSDASTMARFALLSPVSSGVAPFTTQVAYVMANNVYVATITQTGITPSISTVQVTFNGEEGSIINGAPDWVYEEEMFASGEALWWSPNGAFIAFATFDESMVQEYELTMYEGFGYPSEIEYKYPLPGTPNSLVNVSVYTVATNTTAPVNGLSQWADQYVSQVLWASSTSLCVKILNRAQNTQITFLADATLISPTAVAINTQTSTTYIEPTGSSMQFVSPTQYVDIRPNPSGTNMHVALFSTTPNSNPTFLTNSDAWMVTEILGVNVNAGLLFYQSTQQSHYGRDIYYVPLTGGTPVALTSGGSWYDGVLSASGQSLLLLYGGPEVPSATMYYVATSGQTATISVGRTLEDNAALSAALEGITRPEVKYSEIPPASSNTDVATTISVMTLVPPPSDVEQDYPVLMHVYGGPGSQLVTYKFKLDWNVVMASKGYLVHIVDNVGTGGRGIRFQTCTYGNLGVREAADQIAAAAYLSGQPNTKAGSMGIWGWSYGGFMTSSIAAVGESVFNTLIAVAPVTDWRFYDSIYTERYMNLPASNPTGYTATSVVEKADSFNPSQNYFLIHGLADDNVHFMNSAILVEALVNENHQFRSWYYPNKAHSLSGTETRTHLYTMLENYVVQNLGAGGDVPLAA